MNVKNINAIIAYTQDTGYEVEITHVCLIDNKVIGTFEDMYGCVQINRWDEFGKSEKLDLNDLCMLSFPVLVEVPLSAHELMAYLNEEMDSNANR